MESVPVETPPEADLLCPLCDYNLRGLAEPRCPECGHRSTWEELRNRQPTHPYLFEHYPRRNVWSFVRTLFGSIRARKFWRILTPLIDVRLSRLMMFATIVLAMALSGTMLGLAGEVWAMAQRNARQRQSMTQHLTQMMTPGSQYYDAQGAATVQQIIRSYGSIQNYSARNFPDVMSPMFWRQIGKRATLRYWWTSPLVRPTLLALGWAPLTLASLMIFRVSLRQAKIKTTHVARCVIYSGAILALIGPFLLVITPLIVTLLEPYGHNTMFGPVDSVYLACVLFLVILGYRLAVAYSRYLRFDLPYLTVLASQVIVALALIKIDMMIHGM